MWFSSLLGSRQRSAPRGRRHRLPRKPPTYRPRLEALEDRWLPSQIGLTVTSLADSGPGTLRAAIQTADSGSHSDKYTISFAVTGTIDLLTPLPDLNSSSNITIQGPGASNLTVEPAAGASFSSAIITVDSGTTASLSGLTIANGNDGGIVNDGTLTVSGCTVSGNSVPVFGGGIYNAASGTLTVSGGTISDNSAGLIGGGICNFGALAVGGSTVSDNSATNLFANTAGGGIWSGSIFFGATMTVTDCTFSGNTANDGGAISTGGGTIAGSSFNRNSAAFEGGAIATGIALTVRNSSFDGNSSTLGGAIDNQGTLSLNGCAFTNNSVSGSTVLGVTNPGEGGAIYNLASSGFTLDVRGSTFSGNTSSDSGGGIYNLGTATVQESTLSGNTAGSNGGGVFNAASTTLAVKDSTVLKNVAPLGADIYNLGALTQDDSTVGVIGP
jgi:predicted outer membrane repeat protein